MRSDRIETTCLFRGAFFLSKGCELKKIRIKDTGRHYASLVITGEGIDKLNLEYQKGGVLINVLLFKESLNYLKDELFNTLREDEERREAKRRYGYDRKRKSRAHQAYS